MSILVLVQLADKRDNNTGGEWWTIIIVNSHLFRMSSDSNSRHPCPSHLFLLTLKDPLVDH